MPVYTPGGGGGPARAFDENENDALSKPYDVDWPATADTLQQINEMFDILFKSNVKRKDEIVAIEEEPSPTFTDNLTIVTRALTESELEALGTTPIALVTAPGAGLMLQPVHMSFKLVVTTGYGSSPVVRFRFTGNTTDLNASSLNFNWTAANTFIKTSTLLGPTWTFSTFDPRNKAIEVSLDANPTVPGTGVATGIATMAYVTYTL